MFIKKYNQFVKIRINENVDLPENKTGKKEYQEIDNFSEMEEEGGVYIGQKMIQDLADTLGVKPNSDGSVTYNGKKINFYSETEKLHVDNKKFSSVEEVVNYLKGDVKSTSTPVGVKKDEVRLKDNKSLLSTEEEDNVEMETETKFESKSYKSTRKFNKSRKV